MKEDPGKEKIVSHLVEVKELPTVVSTLARCKEKFSCEYAGEDQYKVRVSEGAVIASASAEKIEELPDKRVLVPGEEIQQMAHKAMEEKRRLNQNPVAEIVAQEGARLYQDLAVYMDYDPKIASIENVGELVHATPPYIGIDLDRYLKAHTEGGSVRAHVVWTKHSRGYVSDVLDQIRRKDVSGRFNTDTLDRATQALWAVPVVAEVNPQWLATYNTFAHFNSMSPILLTLTGHILRQMHGKMGMSPINWERYAECLQESLLPYALDYLGKAYNQ